MFYKTNVTERFVDDMCVFPAQRIWNSGERTGGVSAPPKVPICQKFEQSFKNLDKNVSTFFNNINELLLLCYWGYK